jgi:hypothetical protein
MDDLRSNAEIRADAARWIVEISAKLESDTSRKLAFTSPFLDPWTIAVTIGEAVRKDLRFRTIVPNPSPRMTCLQAVHHNNLLDWPSPGISVIRVRPDNLFDPPQRFEMIDSLTEHLASDISYGDAFKIEGGWAVAMQGLDKIPDVIPGYTLWALTSEEIIDLPPATTTGRKKVSVASPRIDAVASKTLKPSREQIKKHLSSGGVLLNYEPARKPGYELVPGDIVAVRGGGRFRFLDIMGASKSGRIYVEVEVLNGP